MSIDDTCSEEDEEGKNKKKTNRSSQMAKSFTFLSLNLALHAVILYYYLYQFLYHLLPLPLYQLPNPDQKRPNSKKPLFYPVPGLIRPYNKIYTLQFYILRISSRAAKCC